MAGWIYSLVHGRKENRLETVCMVGYIAVATVLLFFHEPWRDELQCWAIARESTSFFDLLYKARYEGHPSGWYAILFLITRFTDTFLWVRLCHMLLAGAVIFLILFKSPFTKMQKCLLTFGYFFMYEYAALSRNYILGILLLLLVCTAIKKRKKYWLGICSLLFLALQVNVFSALLACALFTVLFFEPFLFAPKKAWLDKKHLGGLLIFGAGFLVSTCDMLPPSDSTFMPAWTWLNPEWQHALSSFLHAMAPLPKTELHFWNTHILQGFIDWQWLPATESLLAVLLLTGCIFSLRKHSLALAFFLVAWFAIALFLSVKYTGFLRHHGHFFMAYVMALWMKENTIFYQLKKIPTSVPVLYSFKKLFTGHLFFNAILLVHIAATASAIYFDLKYPFTQSSRAASFIKNNYPQDIFLAGHFDYATSPVSFHLNRPVFYPNQNKSGTFIYWSADRFAKEITDIKTASAALCGERGPFLLLTSYPIPATPTVETTFELVKIFSPAVVKEEEYWLYQVTCPAVHTSKSRYMTQ